MLSSVSYQSKVVTFNNLQFWTESFGDKTNPAIVLIMGSAGQGLLWPQEFCEALASKGFYVIRYDNRDTGLSSEINYQEEPYTLLTMAEDVVGILKEYSIHKAHIVGASMGGVIAMLLAAHYPEHMASLTLLMTTTDMRPVFDALQGIATKSSLSAPAEKILVAAKNGMQNPNTLEEKVNAYVDNFRLNSGGNIPIDEELCRELALQTFVRMRNPNSGMNHFLASQASHDLHAAALTKITVPTLIIHGDADPIFPLDHAQAIHKAIPHSQLEIIPDLGHGISNKKFFTPIIDLIVKNKD